MRLTSYFNRLNSLKLVLAATLAAICLTGCASDKPTGRHQLVTDKLPRPAHIWIYDFADTAREIPMDSALSGTEVAPQSAETSIRSQEIGTSIATNLVIAINGMGLSAAPQALDSTVAINDLMIQGYLLTTDEGSPDQRVRRGMSAHASKLVVAVEVYQMTEAGMRKLEYSTANAGGGGKTSSVTSDFTRLLGHGNPLGLIFSSMMPLPKKKDDGNQVAKQAGAVAKEIAGVLKQDFHKQGWIHR